MSGLRVAVVEDDQGVRAALSATLRLAGIDVVATYDSGEGFLAALPDIRLDALLLDLGLPGIGGIETIRLIRAHTPGLPILVLTIFAVPSTIVNAIEAGATGYLLKDTPLDQLPVALAQVREGLSPLSPQVAAHVLSVMRGRSTTSDKDFQLTGRELDVLLLLVEGGSYPEIARGLGIGVGTVQTHIKSIYRKLGVSSKAEAASLAVRHHLVPLDDGR